jgi:hypothetical protein
VRISSTHTDQACTTLLRNQESGCHAKVLISLGLLGNMDATTHW